MNDASPLNPAVQFLSDEMRAEFARMKEHWGALPELTEANVKQMRALDQALSARWNEQPPRMEEVRRFVIPESPELGATATQAVLYRPSNARIGSIIFVHGGGWCLCNLETHSRFMQVLAQCAQQEVVGIHYRRAPENPFPAGLMDVIAASRALRSAPEKFGLSGGNTILCGDSAGANLALASVLHDLECGWSPPIAVMLLYGAFGLDFSSDSYQLYGEEYWLTATAMRKFWDWYLPSPEMRANHLAVPLVASSELLRKLPPALLIAAELDPLASDTLQLKKRLDELGRRDPIHLERGVIHGFLQMTRTLKSAQQVTEMLGHAVRHFNDNACWPEPLSR